MGLTRVKYTQVEKDVSNTGVVLQSSSANIPAMSGTTVVAWSNNQPSVSKGVEIWKLSLKISDKRSKVLISGSFLYNASSSGRTLVAYVFRDSECIGVTAGYCANSKALLPIYIDLVDTPASDSTVNYSIRVAGTSNQTWRVNTLSKPYVNNLLDNGVINLQEIA